MWFMISAKELKLFSVLSLLARDVVSRIKI